VPGSDARYQPCFSSRWLMHCRRPDWRISEVILSVCDVAVSVCCEKWKTDTNSHETPFRYAFHCLTLFLHRDDHWISVQNILFR
jgi:hypothetical protein